MAIEVSSYTPEQVAAVVSGYLAGETVEALAEASGKNVRSVIAKLAREGVYVPKPKKPLETKPTKLEMLMSICNALTLDPKLMQSLEKATYPALAGLHTKILSCSCS